MAATEPAAQVFRFGPFEVDVVNRQLLKKGVSVRLPGQPFDVLALLLEHPGQLVTRRELRDRLWPTGTIVEFDHSIHAAVTRLREALGEDAEHPRFIATVPRHGYRFIAPVSTASVRELGNSVRPPEKPECPQRTPVSDEPNLDAVADRVAPFLSTDTRSTSQASHPDVAAIGAVSGDGVDLASRSPTVSPARRSARRRVTLVLIASLVAAVGYFGADRYFQSKRGAVVSTPEMSIAVLPFVDMSAEKDQEYFSDGLTDELISMLANVQGLRVPGRTSSFYFKGKSETIPIIARTLGVANVLEGSVRKSGNQLRVTAQLLRADNGYHLWSETYDRDLKDVFHVQDEIANAVVAALKVRLSGSQPLSTPHGTSNPQAYDEFLLCRQLYFRSGLANFRRASEACSKAIEFDPKYAAAHAQLAMAEAYVADLTGDGEKLRHAFEAADKAIALGPEQAIGYAARGTLRYNYNFDWPGARSDLARALAISPDDSWILNRYARMLRTLDQHRQAIEVETKALDIDPLLSSAWEGLSYSYQALRNLPAALQTSRRAVDINPDSPYALFRLAATLLLQGKANDALAAFNKMNGAEPLEIQGIAMTEFSLGNEERSREALGRLIDNHADKAPFQIACVYAWRGEKDQAFEWLERARLQHDGGMADVKDDPFLEPLRSNARYKALLHQMNLPE